MNSQDLLNYNLQDHLYLDYLKLFLTTHGGLSALGLTTLGLTSMKVLTPLDLE